MLFEQFQVFRVVEIEGVVVGYRQAHRPARVRFPLEQFLRHQRHQFRLVRDPQQKVQIDIAVDRLGQHADHPIPFLVLGYR